MILEIKAKHIRKGHRCDPDMCMVALAAREQLKADSVSAINWPGNKGGSLRVGEWPNQTTYVLSKACAQKIDAFDRRGKNHVKPFRTRLRKSIVND